jgi:SanA protein
MPLWSAGNVWLLRALAFVYAGFLLIAVLLDMRSRVRTDAAAHIVRSAQEAPARYTAIVLGCRVNGDEPSLCLEERLQAALGLYRTGKVKRVLLSGDHGTVGYDEVNAMRQWLVEREVPLEHIFLDHAGFDTYDTMKRAREIFQVDNALVVSQAFHLPRAVYLARAVGIDALGVTADPTAGSACGSSWLREPVACTKAVLNVFFGASPKFLGPAIPITGSPQASFDR